MKSFFKIAKREGGLFPPRIFSVLLLLVLPTQTVGKHETFLFLLFILEKPQGLICQMGRDPVLPPEWPYILFFTTPYPRGGGGTPSCRHRETGLPVTL